MVIYLLSSAQATAGILAGLYFAFAVAVMPALHGLGDAAFENVMRRINVSIVTPMFLTLFFAAPALACVVAVAAQTPLAYVAAALGIATLLITVLVNVPLNNALAAGGSRADFEGRWVLFNRVRTLTGIASLVCLLLIPASIA